MKRQWLSDNRTPGPKCLETEKSPRAALTCNLRPRPLRSAAMPAAPRGATAASAAEGAANPGSGGLGIPFSTADGGPCPKLAPSTTLRPLLRPAWRRAVHPADGRGHGSGLLLMRRMGPVEASAAPPPAVAGRSCWAAGSECALIGLIVFASVYAVARGSRRAHSAACRASSPCWWRSFCSPPLGSCRRTGRTPEATRGLASWPTCDGDAGRRWCRRSSSRPGCRRCRCGCPRTGPSMASTP